VVTLEKGGGEKTREQEQEKRKTEGDRGFKKIEEI